MIALMNKPSKIKPRCQKCGGVSPTAWCRTCRSLLRLVGSRPLGRDDRLAIGLPASFDDRQRDEPIPSGMRVETWPELFPRPRRERRGDSYEFLQRALR